MFDDVDGFRTNFSLSLSLLSFRGGCVIGEVPNCRKSGRGGLIQKEVDSGVRTSTENALSFAFPNRTLESRQMRALAESLR